MIKHNTRMADPNRTRTKWNRPNIFDDIFNSDIKLISGQGWHHILMKWNTFFASFVFWRLAANLTETLFSILVSGLRVRLHVP